MKPRWHLILNAIFRACRSSGSIILTGGVRMPHQRRKGTVPQTTLAFKADVPLTHCPISDVGCPCRFGWGLGMQYVAKSDLSTGNTTFASHVLKSHDLVRQPGPSVVLTFLHIWPDGKETLRPCAMPFLDLAYSLSNTSRASGHTFKAGLEYVCFQVFAFTAPYSQRIEKNKESKVPCPWYRPEDGLKFIEAHGLGVRAVGKCPRPT